MELIPKDAQRAFGHPSPQALAGSAPEWLPTTPPGAFPTPAESVALQDSVSHRCASSRWHGRRLRALTWLGLCRCCRRSVLVAEASFLIIVGMMACLATASPIRCDQRPPARSRALSAVASRLAQPLLLASRSSPVLARGFLRLLACPDNSSRVQSCCQCQVGGDSDRAVCVRAATLTSSSRRTPSAACLTSISRPRPRAAGSLPPTPSPPATRATGSEFSTPPCILLAAQARVHESCSRASAPVRAQAVNTTKLTASRPALADQVCRRVLSQEDLHRRRHCCLWLRHGREQQRSARLQWLPH